MVPKHDEAVAVNKVVEKVVEVVTPDVVPVKAVDMSVGVVPVGSEVVKGAPAAGDDGDGTR